MAIAAADPISLITRDRPDPNESLLGKRRSPASRDRAWNMSDRHTVYTEVLLDR